MCKIGRRVKAEVETIHKLSDFIKPPPNPSEGGELGHNLVFFLYSPPSEGLGEAQLDLWTKITKL